MPITRCRFLAALAALAPLASLIGRAGAEPAEEPVCSSVPEPTITFGPVGLLEYDSSCTSSAIRVTVWQKARRM